MVIECHWTVRGSKPFSKHILLEIAETDRAPSDLCFISQFSFTIYDPSQIFGCRTQIAYSSTSDNSGQILSPTSILNSSLFKSLYRSDLPTKYNKNRLCLSLLCGTSTYCLLSSTQICSTPKAARSGMTIRYLRRFSKLLPVRGRDLGTAGSRC